MSELYNCTCTKESAVVYKIRVKGIGWANISIREWPNGGSIDIQSDFGNYANMWNAIGEGPFRKFLCGVDMGYFFNKCIGNAYLEFDSEGTVKEIKQDIINDRRKGEIEHGVAREIWDSLCDLHVYSGYEMLVEMGEGAFDFMVDRLYGGDRSALPFINRPKHDCRNFWEQIWPYACEIWRNELAEEMGEVVK